MHVHPDIILGSFNLIVKVNFEFDIHHGIEKDVDVTFYCLLLLLTCECLYLFGVDGKLFVDDTVDSKGTFEMS